MTKCKQCSRGAGYNFKGLYDTLTAFKSVAYLSKSLNSLDATLKLLK